MFSWERCHRPTSWWLVESSQARWLSVLISEWPTIDDVVDSPISLPWHVAMLPHGFSGVQCNHGVFPKHQPYMLRSRSRNKNPQRFFRDWSLRNHGILSLICWKWIWWIWRFKLKLSWWFQTFFIFTPKIGKDSHFAEHIFQMGWFNHLGRNCSLWTIATMATCVDTLLWPLWV